MLLTDSSRSSAMSSCASPPSALSDALSSGWRPDCPTACSRNVRNSSCSLFKAEEERQHGAIDFTNVGITYSLGLREGAHVLLVSAHDERVRACLYSPRSSFSISTSSCKQRIVWRKALVTIRVCLVSFCFLDRLSAYRADTSEAEERAGRGGRE